MWTSGLLWSFVTDVTVDEDYWLKGYTPTASAAPAFLAHVAKDIFLCGKSFSLLRLCTAGQVCQLY